MSRFKALARIYGVLMRRTEAVDLNELEVTGRLWVEPSRSADSLELPGLRERLRDRRSLAALAVAGRARSLSRFSRLAPQLGSAVVAAVFGAFLAADIARAIAAPIVAAMPPWRADLTAYLTQPAGWVLVFLVGLLTLVFRFTLPRYRVEAVTVGTLLAGLVLPAGFGLSWLATLAVLVLLTVVLFASGWVSTAPRSAAVRVAAPPVAGVVAIAVALARPWSTTLLLVAVTVVGIAVSTVDPAAAGFRSARARLVDAARGMAVLAAPGAVYACLLALLPHLAIPVALAAMFLTTSVALAFVAMRLLIQRRIDYPLVVGAILNGPITAGVAIASGGADLLDVAMVLVLLVTVTLLALAPRIDAGRRADRLLDGGDIAVAAATVAVVVCLARIIYRIVPHNWIMLSALAVLVFAVGLRTMPAQWRRGPAVGLAVSLPLIGLLPGFYALLGGGHALFLSGGLWSNRGSDLSAAASPFGWQVPAALVLLAFAAAVALPPPLNHDSAAVAIVLATLGTPAALGWAWWSPIVLGLAVSMCYSVAAVIAVRSRPGYARLAVALAAGFHALLTSLVSLWTTAAVLAILALIGLIAALTSVIRLSKSDRWWPRTHFGVIAALAPTGSLALAVAAAFAADGAARAHPVVKVVAQSISGPNLAIALTLPGISIFVSAFAALLLFTVALRGKTQLARVLGWLGGTIAAQLLVLSVGLNLGVPPRWAAFAFLALGTALITYVVLSNHLWSPPEATAVELAAYASGVIAVALAWSALSLTVVLFGGACILAMDAIRMSRPQRQRRVLLYLAGGLATIALGLLRFNLGSARSLPPEALTLPLAILTFAVGLRRLRRQLEMPSWSTIGPALVAAFAPTLVLVLVPAPAPTRLVALILGAIAVIAWGRITRLRAPTHMGAAVALIAILDALLAAGLIWLVPAFAALALLLIGARRLRRRRILRRLRRLRI